MTKKEKTSLFWKLQISGWFLLLLIYLLLYYRNYLDDVRTLTGLGITYISGFIITLLLRRFYQLIGYHNRSISFISLVILVGTILIANIWFWFDVSISMLIIGELEFFKILNINSYLSRIWSKSIIIFLWSTLYFGIKLWNDWLDAKSRAEKSDALAHKAQLQMLRYQLNPHFLFNSLNSIRALVEEDKNRAKSMITELSEFLRYSLINKNLSDVPLRSELEAMKNYFSIEKTRFEEKLEVTFKIEPETENIIVPSFLIHPLIENAIKYGMRTTALPLKILIKASLQNNNLCLQVCNSGEWLETEINSDSTGTGLNNVKQRLENTFPEQHLFEIIKKENSVCVKITILNILKSDE